MCVCQAAQKLNVFCKLSFGTELVALLISSAIQIRTDSPNNLAKCLPDNLLLGG